MLYTLDVAKVIQRLSGVSVKTARVSSDRMYIMCSPSLSQHQIHIDLLPLLSTVKFRIPQKLGPVEHFRWRSRQRQQQHRVHRIRKETLLQAKIKNFENEEVTHSCSRFWETSVRILWRQIVYQKDSRTTEADNHHCRDINTHQNVMISLLLPLRREFGFSIVTNVQKIPLR